VQRRTVLSTQRLVLTTWVEEDLDELALMHSEGV